MHSNLSAPAVSGERPPLLCSITARHREMRRPMSLVYRGNAEYEFGRVLECSRQLAARDRTGFLAVETRQRALTMQDARAQAPTFMSHQTGSVCTINKRLQYYHF